MAADTIGESSVAAPDSPKMDGALPCPRCSYDLRLLPQPRCPECGLEFEWETVIAATTRPSTPLFEYQWRRRPLRAFVRTFASALIPPLLWRQTPLEAKPRLLPLVLLVGTALLVYLLSLHLIEQLYWLLSGQRMLVGLQWRACWLDARLRVAGVLIPLLGGWLLLQVFRQTYRRFRVRQDQLGRIVLLCAFVLLTWKILAHASVWAYELWWLRFRWVPPGYELTYTLSELLPGLVAVVTLCIGLSGHLRIRRGWAVGLLVIGTLVIALTTGILSIAASGSDSLRSELIQPFEMEWLGPARYIDQALMKLGQWLFM